MQHPAVTRPTMEGRAGHTPQLSKVNLAAPIQWGLQTSGWGKSLQGTLTAGSLRATRERSSSVASGRLRRWCCAPPHPRLPVWPGREGARSRQPPPLPRPPGASGRSPHAPHPTNPSPPRQPRAAGMPAPRSPARVVSVRSWLAAPRGNSLSFRPLRLSTPVTAASSRARSTERLHEPGTGPGPTPGLGPQLAPERFPPDATGPEYSAAAATATKPAAAISQPTTLRAGSAHAPPEPLGGRGKGLGDPGQLSGRAGAPPMPRFSRETKGRSQSCIGSLFRISSGISKRPLQKPSLTTLLSTRLPASVLDYFKQQRFLALLLTETWAVKRRLLGMCPKLSLQIATEPPDDLHWDLWIYY